MKVKVQVVTFTDDSAESIREVACVERDALTPASLGLSIADSKAILQAIQEVVPLIVGAAGGIGFRADRSVRAPDDFELAGLHDPAKPKDLP